jgi:hypothetical protein
MLKIGQRKAVGLTEGHANKSQASDKELYGAIRDELDAVKAGVVALAVKMDADFADVANASVDYESTLSLGANLFQK